MGAVAASGAAPPAVTFTGTPDSGTSVFEVDCTLTGIRGVATVNVKRNGVSVFAGLTAATLGPYNGVTIHFPVGAYTNGNVWISDAVVTNWLDTLSGSGYAFAVGALVPPNYVAGVYGPGSIYPAIRGADATRTLVCAAVPSLATTGTVVMVIARTALASSYIAANASGSSLLLENFTPTLIEYYNSPDRQTLATAPAAGLHQLILSQTDGVNCTGYFDGVAAFSIVPTVSVAQWIATDFQIFGLGTGANGTSGDIEELFIARTAANATQAAALHAYSQGFWGTP